jgi:hypothetical protein
VQHPDVDEARREEPPPLALQQVFARDGPEAVENVRVPAAEILAQRVSAANGPREADEEAQHVGDEEHRHDERRSRVQAQSRGGPRFDDGGHRLTRRGNGDHGQVRLLAGGRGDAEAGDRGVAALRCQHVPLPDTFDPRIDPHQPREAEHVQRFVERVAVDSGFGRVARREPRLPVRRRDAPQDGRGRRRIGMCGE